MKGYQILILFIIVIFIVYSYFSNRRKRRKTIASIREDESVLAKWSYSPEEWKKYAEDAFSEGIKNKDVPGEAFVTPTNIFVTNGIDECLFDTGKLTHSSYSGSFIKLRIDRLKSSGSGSNRSTVLQQEDFRLLVPVSNEEKVPKLLAEFNARIQANPHRAEVLEFVRNKREITSLFGSDEI